MNSHPNLRDIHADFLRLKEALAMIEYNARQIGAFAIRDQARAVLDTVLADSLCWRCSKSQGYYSSPCKHCDAINPNFDLDGALAQQRVDATVCYECYGVNEHGIGCPALQRK